MADRGNLERLSFSFFAAAANIAVNIAQQTCFTLSSFPLRIDCMASGTKPSTGWLVQDILATLAEKKRRKGRVEPYHFISRVEQLAVSLIILGHVTPSKDRPVAQCPENFQPVVI